MWRRREASLRPPSRRLRIRLSGGGRRRRKIDNLSQICASNFHIAPIVISADLLSVDGPIGGARPEIRFNIVRKAESHASPRTSWWPSFSEIFAQLFSLFQELFTSFSLLKWFRQMSNKSLHHFSFFHSRDWKFLRLASRAPSLLIRKFVANWKFFSSLQPPLLRTPYHPPCQKPNWDSRCCLFCCCFFPLNLGEEEQQQLTAGLVLRKILSRLSTLSR